MACSRKQKSSLEFWVSRAGFLVLGLISDFRVPLVMPARAYLCIDINGERDAYSRAVDFVSKTNLRYGLTSEKLEELGGSEKNRLPELYSTDFDWKDKGYIITKAPADKVVVELFDGCPVKQ